MSIPNIKEVVFTLYPNPVDNQLNVQLTELSQGASYSIYNINGKQLQSHPIIELESIIDVASCASGVYFIKLTDASGKVQTKKFIKR